MIELHLPRFLRPVTRAIRSRRHAPTVVTVLDIRQHERARRTEIVIAHRDR